MRASRKTEEVSAESARRDEQRRIQNALVAFADGKADLGKLLPGWKPAAAARSLPRLVY